ncbi:hypothetical protein B7463_g6989, partial [Scytalidium lignicola]
MGLYTKLLDDIKEVDVIIAGAFSCVIAARLADVDLGLSILVMEGGTNNDMPSVAHPAFFFSHPTSKTSIFYKGNMEKQLADREVIVASGGPELNDKLDFETSFFSGAHSIDIKKHMWAYKKQREIMRRMETYRGTCKMTSPEKMGVVDTKLNVYDVQGLKITDLSIVPRNVAANTYNTALAISEKAADIFIKELGLGLNKN